MSLIKLLKKEGKMNLYQSLISQNTYISVIGLGYVGLPIAVAFSEQNINVIGFDINKDRIKKYKNGNDITEEVGNQRLKNTDILFTDDVKDLNNAKFHIVAVPTPINQDKTPNLDPVISATRMVGEQISKGSMVVFESTVYPGVTEDICIPLLENVSGLVCGVDFKVGYSPERINPGDKKNTLETIVKIVSGSDEDAMNEIAKIYEIVIKAGVHRAPNIKVAEAAKVVENSQRDINIAFMNELAMVFDLMSINTSDVIEAMNTKWNALKFTPGLVGGHCIGVDPYYFVYEAEKLGYHSQIITSGRKINDGMAKFVVNSTLNSMIRGNQRVLSSRVGIFGVTFKENCPDTRNSKVFDIIEEFKSLGIEPLIHDPYADHDLIKKDNNITLSTFEEVKNLDVMIIAVSHDFYKSISSKTWQKKLRFSEETKAVLVDIKSIMSDLRESQDLIYWSL